MHESLLGDANRQRLLATQPAEIQQKKELDTQHISSRLLDSTDVEVLRDIGLELFNHIDTSLAARGNSQEGHRTSQTEDSNSAPDEELSHARDLINLIDKKLLRLPLKNADNAAIAFDYAAHALIAEVGLALLVLVSLIYTSYSEPFLLDDAVLIHIVTYTDEDDAWTTEESSRLASRLLEASLAGDALDTFIIQRLLHDTLRPLFSKSSARLTASGRPSKLANQPSETQAMTSFDSPSQEQEKLYAASSFRWAVKSCSQAAVGRHWPLFLPILLSLAEDHNTRVRIKGLHIIGLFLDTCPANTILSAGIDNVIQEAVFPTLLFLPSTTPESESIELLYPAYRVLLRIAQLDPDPKSLRRRRLLDKLLRDGVFAGHFHASQNARIVVVLMNVTKDIISCLGLYSAKHLQSLLRLFSTTLSDPFVMAYPPLVCATTEALDATLINCWPRFSSPGYIDQVIHTISLCWLSLKTSELSTEEKGQVSTHLLRTSTILQSLWSRQDSAPPDKLAAVLQKEPQLIELFPNILK